MSGPHDRLVREIFTRPEALRWLLRAALPSAPIADALRVLPDVHLHHGRERRADLAADLPEHHLRVFVEHQSTPRDDMALRCIEHLAIAARAHRRSAPSEPTPRIHFLVLFQGPGRWAPSTSLADPHLPPLAMGIAEPARAAAFTLCHLQDLAMDTAPADARLAVRLLVRASQLGRGAHNWLLDPAHIDDLHRVRRHLGRDAVFTFIGYLGDIAQSPPPESLMALIREKDPDLEDDFISYNDQLRMEGERAERERAATTQREVLRDLASQRFGEPSPWHSRRLRRLTLDQILDATRRVLRACDWDDLIP